MGFPCHFSIDACGSGVYFVPFLSHSSSFIAVLPSLKDAGRWTYLQLKNCFICIFVTSLLHLFRQLKITSSIISVETSSYLWLKITSFAFSNEICIIIYIFSRHFGPKQLHSYQDISLFSKMNKWNCTTFQSRSGHYLLLSSYLDWKVVKFHCFIYRGWRLHELDLQLKNCFNCIFSSWYFFRTFINYCFSLIFSSTFLHL